MKIKILILAIIFSINLSMKAEEFLAESGYNSNTENLEQIKAKENAIAFFACVGCHNSKATYSVMMKEGDAYSLKYYAGNKSKISDMNKNFSLSKEDALELIEILGVEISKAKGASTHKEGAKRGSSFEFAVKTGDEWNVAGHYSKGAYPLAKRIADLIKAKKESEIPEKMKKIREAK